MEQRGRSGSMIDRLHALDEAHAELLRTLLQQCEASGGYADAKPFRVASAERRVALNELECDEYIRRVRDAQRDCYRVLLPGIWQLSESSEEARRIMGVAESLWAAYQSHYQTHFEAPVGLKELSVQLELDVETVSRVHTYMREFPDCPVESCPADSLYQYVAVQERVLDFERFSDCVAQIRRLQSDRIANSSAGQVISFLPNEGEFVGGAMLPHVAVPALPSWADKLPPQVASMFGEVHTGIAADLRALTAMGIRAMVDLVSFDHFGEDLGTFKAKLSRLAESGRLTAQQHHALDAVVEAGNAAAHRGFTPSADELRAMMSALSVLLQSIYILDEVTVQLRAATPPRPPKPKR